jgi:type II secretory pathway pseudopilin PulG
MIRYFTIAIVILAVPFTGYILYKINQRQKQENIKGVIDDLESYRLKYGKYPKNFSNSIAKQVDGIYYYPDSLYHSFYLSYSSGIMNSNTHRYNSETKKWEELFNY